MFLRRDIHSPFVVEVYSRRDASFFTLNQYIWHMQQHRFSAEIGKQAGSMGLHFIEIPADIAETMFQTFPARAIVQIHGIAFHAGVLRRKDGYYLVQMGKATLKKIKASLGECVEVILMPDNSEYGYEMPEEMQVLLDQDEDGRKVWEATSPGMKRSLLHYVNSAKSTDVRIKRAILILQRAAELQAEKERKKRLKKGD